MRRPSVLIVLALIAISVSAQTDTDTSGQTTRARTTASGPNASEIRALKDAIAAQQQQIQQLQQHLQSRDQALQSLQRILENTSLANLVAGKKPKAKRQQKKNDEKGAVLPMALHDGSKSGRRKS